MTSVRRLSLRRWKARLWSRQHHDPHQPHQNRLFRWGPVDPNSIPHFVQPPHSHHGLPILGKDDVSDLPEFEPP